MGYGSFKFQSVAPGYIRQKDEQPKGASFGKITDVIVHFIPKKSYVSNTNSTTNTVIV